MTTTSRRIAAWFIAAVCVVIAFTATGTRMEAASAEPSASALPAVPCVLNPACIGGKAADAGKSAGSVISHTACSAPGASTLCHVASDTNKAAQDIAGGISGSLKQLKLSVDAMTAALRTVASFNPRQLPEMWAKAALHGVVWLLGKVQALAGRFATPGYGSAWWGREYAVTYGLALVLLPFMLLYVGARVGGRDGPVGGVTLAREVVSRLPWAVPGIVLAPALMIVTQGLLAQLAKGFGAAGNAQSGSAVDAFMREIANAPHGNGFFAGLGGAFMALVLLIVAIMFGIAVLLELAFANWGANFFGLLVPLAVVFAIYPPWRKVLGGLIAFLIGIWLIPFAVNFVFWSVWAAADNATAGDTFGTLLYVIVGLMMLAIVPTLVPVVLMRLMPEYHGPMSSGADVGYSQNRGGNQSERRLNLSRQRSPEPEHASYSDSGSGSSGQPTQPPQPGGPGQSAQPGQVSSPGKPVNLGKPGGAPQPVAATPGSVGAPGTSGSPSAPVGTAAATAPAGGGVGAVAGTAAGATVGVAGVAAAAVAKKMKSETYRARNRWTRH